MNNNNTPRIPTSQSKTPSRQFVRVEIGNVVISTSCLLRSPVDNGDLTKNVVALKHASLDTVLCILSLNSLA